jgi:hypothetical protein
MKQDTKPILENSGSDCIQHITKMEVLKRIPAGRLNKFSKGGIELCFLYRYQLALKAKLDAIALTVRVGVKQKLRYYMFNQSLAKSS